jgi:molecular chaperone DnaK
MPQIEVTFDIDANGIVNVSAKDTATGKEQAMTITGGTALPREEIDRMMKEAEAAAASEHKRREEAEARNQADNAIYAVEKSLKEAGDKVSADDKQNIESKLETAREALKAGDVDKVKKATEELLEASHQLAQHAYAQAQDSQATAAGGPAAGAGGAGEQGAAQPDDVVEGEVVDEGESA